MDLKNKLRELRISHKMTQEDVGKYLKVSSQTVSKWERGLLFPDIALLPKIALLFKCSIDSLFDMDLVWSIEHRKEFESEIRELHNKKNWEGIYQAWIHEIELNPDNYKNYPDVMLHIFRKKLYKKEYVEKMISLADHAEKCCSDDDIRNEIYRIMLQICAESDNNTIQTKSRYYYKKLPQLRHSREVYARFVMDGEEYRSQVLKNIIYTIDLAECSIRQLILPDMPIEEKLFFYQKAAALYETVLDGKYAGFYALPLLSNYCEIAKLHVQLKQSNLAAAYVTRILNALEAHLINDGQISSELLYSTNPENSPSTDQLCINLLRHMQQSLDIQDFSPAISELLCKFETSLNQGKQQ